MSERDPIFRSVSAPGPKPDRSRAARLARIALVAAAAIPACHRGDNPTMSPPSNEPMPETPTPNARRRVIAEARENITPTPRVIAEARAVPMNLPPGSAEQTIPSGPTMLRYEHRSEERPQHPGPIAEARVPSAEDGASRPPPGTPTAGPAELRVAPPHDAGRAAPRPLPEARPRRPASEHRWQNAEDMVEFKPTRK